GVLRMHVPPEVNMSPRAKEELQVFLPEFAALLRAETLVGRVVTEAMDWLVAKLTHPVKYSTLAIEWDGLPNRPTGRDLAALFAARRALGIESNLEADGLVWWRMPTVTRH